MKFNHKFDPILTLKIYINNQKFTNQKRTHTSSPLILRYKDTDRRFTTVVGKKGKVKSTDYALL